MFVQARNYTKGRSKRVRFVVIHSMESCEGKRTAEDVAAWFASRGAPQASAHECIDADSVVGCVRDTDTAWAAPGANSDGVHLELAGMAEQSTAQWEDAYSRQVLALAAKRAAFYLRKYSLPVRWLTAAELRDGKSKGLTTHVDITNSGIGKGDHWDPGPHFPRDVFASMLAAEMAALGGQPWTRSYVGRVAAVLGVAAAIFAGVSAIPDPKPAPRPPAATTPFRTPVGMPVLAAHLPAGYGWFLTDTTYRLDSIGRRYGLSSVQARAFNPGLRALVPRGTPVRVRGNADRWNATAYSRL